MNIAILGSAGQIGAYLEEYLKERGHDVIGVSLKIQTLYFFSLLMLVVLGI